MFKQTNLQKKTEKNKKSYTKKKYTMEEPRIKFFNRRHYCELTVNGKKKYFRSTSELLNYCNENGIEVTIGNVTTE